MVTFVNYTCKSFIKLTPVLLSGRSTFYLRALLICHMKDENFIVFLVDNLVHVFPLTIGVIGIYMSLFFNAIVFQLCFSKVLHWIRRLRETSVHVLAWTTRRVF